MRGVESRADDGRVARASAQMTAQQVADIALIGRRMVAQEVIKRHEDSGRAKAALQRVMTFERGLQDAKALV